MKPPVAIIIPSYNNPQYLNPCLFSIICSGALGSLCELIVVNNGEQPIKDFVKDWPATRVLEPKKNLGWEGGLELGMKESDSPFVVFQNDDTLIPQANAHFYGNLLSTFQNDNVAAVGPATTTAAGWHSVFQRYPLRTPTEVSFLIFFTAMIRRDHYNMVGGIDTSCPGGDDLDLSIRLRKAGKKLIVNPSAFIIHHGFKTGERVRGTPDTAHGWNSKEMIDATNKFLIQKHGFKTFLDTMRGLDPFPVANEDKEGNIIASMVREGKVLELGCGAKKTVPQAVGVDRVPYGEIIPHVGQRSIADITADVSGKLPIEDETYDVVIARHILEHCIDPVKTIQEWSRVLKPDGQIIIAVPNEKTLHGIPLNPEHVHAFTPDSLASLMTVCGLAAYEVADPENGISFIARFNKKMGLSAMESKEVDTANA